MAPKKRPVPKTAAAAKPKKADAPDSPSAISPDGSGKNSTPLLERLKMRSGNSVDMNTSSQSAIRESLSPLTKKPRSEVEERGTPMKVAPRLSVEHENSIAKNVPTDQELENLRVRLAKVEEAEATVRALFEQETLARQKVEEDLKAELAHREELERATSDRKSTRKSLKEDASAMRKVAQLEKALEDSEKVREELQDEVARITEAKENLENQYDDALNNTLMSFKSPGPNRRGVASGRKSTGRLSLSGYADEFANMGVSNAEYDTLHKRVAELEHIIERQADEIDKYIKKGSADDSYDMEGLDQRFIQLQEQLDTERSEATRFREETSRLSAQVDLLTSENGVLTARVRNYQEEELAYEATSAEVESLQSETLTMRSEIETQKKRIFNADLIIEQLTKQVETSKNHIFSLEDRVKILERDLEASNYNNNALEQVLTRKNTVLNTELSNARSEIRKLRDECGEAKTLNHKSKQEIIDLNTNGQRWQARATDYEMKYQQSELESKRAKSELESVRREAAVSLRNMEIREQEMTSTLTDNQAEMGALSVEFRNVKLERDHLINQVRNISDQLHEMKHNNAEVLNETGKKHEAELMALRQNKAELEALLQSVRREKSHYENQCKVAQKEESNAILAATNRVRELEQTVEAQKKLNARLQRENSLVDFVPPEQTTASQFGKGISVLGSPPAPRPLQAHASVPVAPHATEPAPSVPAAVPVGVSPARVLQHHPTAPISDSVSSSEQPQNNNPLAFWKAKINNARAAAAIGRPPAESSTPKNSAPVPAGRTPLLAARTPQPAVQSPFFPREPVVIPQRISRVEAVQKEFEMEDNLSPIIASVSEIPELTMDVLEKENPDTYLRAWRTALSSKPAEWQNALSRVPGGSGLDTFQFGTKRVQCRLVGSDMLVIDGKAQMLVDKFLDKLGEACINGEIAAPSEQPSVPQAPVQNDIKKGGLRFKNLRKQPLTQSNEMDGAGA